MIKMEQTLYKDILKYQHGYLTKVRLFSLAKGKYENDLNVASVFVPPSLLVFKTI